MKKLIFILINGAIMGTSFAQELAIKEGVDYTVITPPAKAIVMKPGKVNVSEFFSYACIHCAVLEPLLDKWLASSKNIELNRIQVVWDGHFSGYAKINATAQMLNLDSKFNQQAFAAVMNQHQNLEDPAQLKIFLTANKALVDPSKFMATYNSFAVSTKPQEYSQYTQAYNINGTPTFIVANRYMTKPAQPAQLVQVVQALVDKVKHDSLSRTPVSRTRVSAGN